MKRLVAVLLAAGLLTAAQARAGDAKKETDSLQGTWAAVSAEADGKALPVEQVKDLKLVFQGDKYTFKTPDHTIAGTFKLDPGKTPKAIDATRSDGPDKGKVIHGIYQLEGNQLKMCFGAPGQETRPKDFAPKAGQGFRLYALKRTQP